MATIGVFTLIGAASGALIGSLSGAIWSVARKKPSEENKSPTRFREKQDEYHVSAGTIEGKITPDSPMNIIRVGDIPLVRGYIKNGELLIDARLYAGPGFNPVEIKGNEFALKDPMWDRNYNDTSLEIVNENGIPVMQVIYTTSQNVVIYGIFQAPNQIYLLTPEGTKMLSVNTQITKELYNVKKIFKYPSRKYLGQEAKEEKNEPAALPHETDWLTDTQKGRISQVLRAAIQNRASVRLVCIGNPCPKYADQIQEAFASAGWSMTRLNILTAILSGPEPMTEPLYTLAPKPDAPVVKTVIEALGAAGLSAPLHLNGPPFTATPENMPAVTIVIQKK
jgi:hypothetical protein